MQSPLLLRALRLEQTERAPVWLMRQAGRSDPAYLAYRQQSGKHLEDLFGSVSDMVAISLLPARLGVDAIILFQDILTPLGAMGARFIFRPAPKLVSSFDFHQKRLRPLSPARQLSFVGDAIKELRSRTELPILGFAGAPLTLLAFLIEGKSPPDLNRTIALAEDKPKLFAELIKQLTDATIAYLRFQIESGVQAVQLFESLGHLLPKTIYEKFVQPSHQQIFQSLQASVPSILFVRGSPWLDAMLASGAKALSLASHVNLNALQKSSKGKIALQGNIDNRLLRDGTPSAITQAVHDCLAQTNGQGHVVNLNHGVFKDTPPANIKKMINATKAWKPSDCDQSRTDQHSKNGKD